MKAVLIILTLVLATGQCWQHLESRIQRLHKQNEKLVKDLEPTVNELVSLRNSINIQGRALSPDEIAFTGRVNDVEFKYLEVREELSALRHMPLDSARLVQEQSLNKLLTSLRARTDSMMQHGN